MSSNSDVIASFSPDALQFAFQSNLSQKTVIDIYPLDANNDYSVNSSLVSHMDYESNDMHTSEIFFTGWCSGLEDDGKQRVKRKTSDDVGLENGTEDKVENFFVSVQNSGKIVVFSSGGKNIVNIIQSKSDILQVSLESSFIWTLDSEKTVKKFQYNQTKQLRSFHLVDGVDAEIVYFELLKCGGVLYLCYATSDTLYIVDPTKRRPNTVAKLSFSGCKSCELLDTNKVAVATTEKMSVLDYKTHTVEQEWDVEVDSLIVVKDVILCRGSSDRVVGFKLGTESPVCQVRIAGAQLLDVAEVENGFMIAWLNVNEPNFKKLTLNDLIGNDEVIIKGLTDKSPTQIEPSVDAQKDNETSNIEQKVEKEALPSRKITKAEQIELNRSLVSALESQDNDQILNILVSEAWNEAKIKSFIVTQAIPDNSINSLFELTTSELQKTPWDNNEVISLWIKWLLTFKAAGCFGSPLSKHAKKQNKRLKSALKASGETLPILLGIQGRLEMLKRQAQLREDLAQLNLTEGEPEADEEPMATEDDKEPSRGTGDPDDSIAYANGESDTFVDASEFTDTVK